MLVVIVVLVSSIRSHGDIRGSLLICLTNRRLAIAGLIKIESLRSGNKSSKALILFLPWFLAVDIRLGPVVLLEQSSPGGDVDVHLLWTRHLALLSEYLSLSPQLWFPSDQRVEEFDLGKEYSLRFELKSHSMPEVVYKLFKLAELDGAQRSPILPVDEQLQLPAFLQLDGEPLIPCLYLEVTSI